MSPIHPRLKGGHDVSLPRRAWATCLLVGLWGCAGPLVGASTAVSASMLPISQISIERDCFGCASATLLVMRADGTAQRLQRGNARHGTQDLVTAGRVRAEDFVALAP